MTKSSGLIDDREKEIASRVRHVRFQNQLSQPEFAKELGLSLDRVASIEYARTPVTVEVADKISAKFDVSLRWLALGLGRSQPCFGLISLASPETKGSMLLSEAYTEKLESSFADRNLFFHFSLAAVLTGEASLPKGKAAEKYLLHFENCLDEAFHAAPHAAKEKLLNEAFRMLSSFSLDQELGVNPESENQSVDPEQKDLTQTSNFRNTPGEMKLTLKGLLNEVRKLTEPSGMKARLAADLKVPQARVSEWLSGKHDPSGEMTLQLFNWVENQKRK